VFDHLPPCAVFIQDQKDGQATPYYLTVNRDERYPGRFCLYYMRKTRHQVEDIKCTQKGLRFRNVGAWQCSSVYTSVCTPSLKLG
jgi:hypothetical protein